MAKVRVESFTISLDGFGAGPDQTLENPMGAGGSGLHKWAFTTKTFRTMVFGQDGGSTGIDESFAQRGFRNIGALVMGRNMFGPVRGDWPDMTWRGWWGENPPYHVPVYVLTHYPREPLVMDGGNVFHFITGGAAEAMRLAKAAAGDKDVRVGGGTQTIREYLAAGAIDEMHLVVSPVLLGRGEHLMAGLDLPALGYQIGEAVRGEETTHYVITRRA